MTEACKRLEVLFEKHPDLKGQFVGFKKGRGLGIGRLDNDWYECDTYVIDADSLAEFFQKTEGANHG